MQKYRKIKDMMSCLIFETELEKNRAKKTKKFAEKNNKKTSAKLVLLCRSFFFFFFSVKFFGFFRSIFFEPCLDSQSVKNK